MEEAGQALFAEDDYWCDHSDDEDQVPLTLMAKIESDDEEPIQIRTTLMAGDDSEDSQSVEDDGARAQVSISDFEQYKAQMLEMMDKSNSKIKILKSTISSHLNNVKQLQQENFQISLEKQLLQEMFDNIQSEKAKFDTKETELWTNIPEK